MRIEDAGRYRIVRLLMQGHPISAIVQEGQEISADPQVEFDPRGVHLYADSWRVDVGVGTVP